MEKIFNNWDEYFMSMAVFVSMKSKDISTRVGSVIVGKGNEIVSTGFNGMPRGVKENKHRFDRPVKYLFFEHAERNAIYNAARIGVPILGCKMYTQFLPCCECSRAIIQSGISEVIILKGILGIDSMDKKWKDMSITSRNMFEESEVKVREYDGKIVHNLFGLVNGKKIFFRDTDNIGDSK